jgi:tetratricopeptide (TPR) repeat protein
MPLRSILVLFSFVAFGTFAGCGDSGSSNSGRGFNQQVQDAQRLSSPGLKAARLMDIAAAQRIALDRSGAEDTLGLARKACEATTEPGEQARLLARLGLEYHRCDNKANARHAISAAKSAKDKIARNTSADYRAHVLALTGLAEAFHALGESNDAIGSLRQAEDLTNEMKTEKDVDQLRRAQAENFITIASTYHALDRPEPAKTQSSKALELARQIGNPYERTKSLAEVATLQNRIKLNEADATFELAQKSLEEVKQPRERAHALVAVAQALQRAGQGGQAKKLLDEAEKLADQSPEFRDELLKKIRAARPRE